MITRRRVSLQHLIIDRVAVISAIGGQRTHRAHDFVQQIRGRRNVADIIRGQFYRGYLLRIGVDRQMQLASAAARPDPVFLIEPFAFALTPCCRPVLSALVPTSIGHRLPNRMAK
jgi:hypothetical protein